MTSSTLQKKLEQAFALQQTQQIPEAIALFKQILVEFPNQADALHALGMAFVQLQDVPQAMGYLQQAVQVAPHLAEFHNNLANAYKALGKANEAMRHYHQALRLKSPYPEAHNNLGALLYRMGQYDKAISHFQKSLRINPTLPDTHYNLANCYIQLERFLDALPHYQQVLITQPEHGSALHNLGITFCVLKRFDQAEPLLSQVIKKEPNNIEALFHLGVIYSALANTTLAKDCYQRVLAIAPQHANSHHNLATIYLHLHQNEQALSHYQAALQLQPNNKTAQHMIDALTGKTVDEGAPFEYTRALFDQYAYNYEQHVKDHLHYQVPYLLRSAISPLLDKLNAPLQILDLGCGTGLCAPFFADIAANLIGIDVSPNMIEVARQKQAYQKLYVTDGLTFLKDRFNQFDVIIGADVLIYFGELKTIFSACYQALQSPGLFCFSIEVLDENILSTLTDFQLKKTGRYAHHQDYIQTISSNVGFTLAVAEQQTIRSQENEPVSGMIYVLKK